LIAVCCIILGVCDEYQLPYHDAVPSDPTLEEMCRVVAVEGQRPVIPNHWQNHTVFQSTCLCH